MQEVINYYNRYDEDSRLVRDNYHRTEFMVTLKLLEPYLQEGARILDAGAGTGRYACHYAGLGYQVDALDLTPKHVEMIREKAQKFNLEDRLGAFVGNACDLSLFPDESYDMVLCMGPLYHLPDEAGRVQCLKECLRVLKPGGVLAIAYVNRAGEYLYRVAATPVILTEQPPAHALAGTTGLVGGGCFVVLDPHQVEDLAASLPLAPLAHASTDGLSAVLRETVNHLTEEQYAAWLDYMMAVCRDSNQIGTSLHNLYIGRKEPD